MSLVPMSDCTCNHPPCDAVCHYGKVRKYGPDYWMREPVPKPRRFVDFNEALKAKLGPGYCTGKCGSPSAYHPKLGCAGVKKKRKTKEK